MIYEYHRVLCEWRHVLYEWPALKAAAAVARWQIDCASTTDTAVVANKRAISTHTRGTAVKHGRLCQVILEREPIPVLAR
jgi:hypothetical protein